MKQGLRKISMFKKRKNTKGKRASEIETGSLKDTVKPLWIIFFTKNMLQKLNMDSMNMDPCLIRQFFKCITMPTFRAGKQSMTECSLRCIALGRYSRFLFKRIIKVMLWQHMLSKYLGSFSIMDIIVQIRLFVISEERYKESRDMVSQHFTTSLGFFFNYTVITHTHTTNQTHHHKRGINFPS